MRKLYRIEVPPLAEWSVDDVRAWREANRLPGRGEIVTRELAKAYRRIARLPFAAALVHVNGRYAETARYLVLDAIGCNVYYDVIEEKRMVIVLLLWGARREAPKLRVKMQPKTPKPKG